MWWSRAVMLNVLSTTSPSAEIWPQMKRALSISRSSPKATWRFLFAKPTLSSVDQVSNQSIIKSPLIITAT